MSSVVVPTATGPIDASLRPPGSKSETIRALCCAALGSGRSHIYSALEANDTHAMRAVLAEAGVNVDTSGEVWAVDGLGGRFHLDDAVLDANESGLTARIGLVLAGSAEGTSTLTGQGRLPERPFAGLVRVLIELGVEIDGTRPPFHVTGHGPLWGGLISVDCSETSQFASAVMLFAPTMTEAAQIDLVNLRGSQGYLDMTASIMGRFGASVRRSLTAYEVDPTGYTSTDVVITPDASSAIYPMVAAAITGGRVVIEGVASSQHPDMRVVTALSEMGCEVSVVGADLAVTGPDTLAPLSIDMSGSPDGALALVIACLHSDGVSSIRGLASLRHKESDRLEALGREVAKLGGELAIEADSIEVQPRSLHGAELDSHGDHRMAMSLALVGLTTPGVVISDPGVVTKTWPQYWSVLNDLAG